MPEHTSPAAALEPFVLLANGAKGAAAISLINQVLEAPSVYVFGELLDHANIADLKNSHADGPSHLRLLEIFAYGTYSDYINDHQISSLPNLTDGMLKKVSFSVAILIKWAKTNVNVQFIQYSRVHILFIILASTFEHCQLSYPKQIDKIFRLAERITT